jgi:membrane-bound lytic murein transglycosylase D
MDIFKARNSARILRGLALALPLVVVFAGCEPKPPAVATDADSGKATAPALAPAPQVQAPAPATTAAQRKEQDLIAAVERAFRSGETHYRRGQLVQAKADFDNAVDMMLASGQDIKADPQLSEEFNRILDAVNALEVEALKQGNGFSAPEEPTPADLANDVTFKVDPNLVAKAKQELTTTKSDIPLVINDYVAAFINVFANTQRGHNTLKHSLQRSGRYKAMIGRIMAEEGVPQDLIYLAVAESAFQPQVVNHSSGAGGMWQFMPHDKYYGLASNAYVDERFDPEKSTRATARYMKFIYNQLGDWYLAMAGYNWGSGSVQRAVQKTGYADFWELYKRNNLPEQTKNYVPEIIAAIIIAKNPTQYGFDDVQLDPPIVYDTVPVNYSVDLRLVADIVDAQPQELAALNPSLLRMVTPPPGVMDKPFDLHLPPGTATLFQQRIADIPEDRRAQWRYHRVTPEDSLASVARTYRVTVDQLATANQLTVNDTLANVDALVVPQPLPSAPVVHTEVYKAHRGDTLVTIADRFGVSMEDLHRWNHVSGVTVTAGQRIRVAEPARVAVSSRNRTASSAHVSSRASGRAASGKRGSEQKITTKLSSKQKKSTTTVKAHSASDPHKTGVSKRAEEHHKSTPNKKVKK